MMKRLLYYLCVLFIIASCMFDENKGVDKALDDSSPEGKVLVTFSVPGVQIAPSTKGLDTGDGDIESEAYLDPDRLYVVVCGNSQNIKYIRKATLLGQKDAWVDTIPDFPPYLLQEYQDSGQTNTTVTVYTFSVLLEVEDQIRTIHFLGNIDVGQLASGEYAYRLLPSLVSLEGKQAYWQKVKSSIRPKTDPNSGEYMIDPQTHAYIPSDETLENLQFIPLIRNYAKIQVTNNTDNFLLYSYTVCNVPSLGSVTPFRSNLPFYSAYPDTGFTFRPETVDFPENYRLSGYERCLAGSLDSLGYPGNLPAKARIEERLPSEYDFLHPGESGGRVLAYTPNSNQGFFIYERGIPNAGQDKPTVIILCGRFKAMKDGSIDPDDNTIDPEHDELFYYRLDLMETKKVDNQSVSQYYPIYRNFRYNIVVRMITSNGLETPLAALNASKVEDISADVSMRHLADISNGTTRLVVEPFMSRTYTGPHPQNPDPSSPRQYYELYARFFNHLDDVVPNKADWAVQVELEQAEDGEDILALYDADGNRVVSSSFRPTFWPTADEEGLRVIRFDVIKVPEAGSAAKKQIIKITGRNYGDENFNEDLRLYREVEIYVQPPQKMVVECMEKPLSKTIGSRQPVRVYIPNGLTEAMFPLVFTLEAEDLTLTPDNTAANNNLPVLSGSSISDNVSYAGKTTIQFTKTLSLEDYYRLPVDQNKGMRYFDCIFKSTVNNSATTVWVYNEFFEKGHDRFFNQNTTGEFTDLSFTSYIPRRTGATIPVHIELYTSEPGEFPVMTVAATGMTINGETSYTFTPTAESFNLNFESTVDNGDVSLSISADGYPSKSISSHYFRDFGFVDGIKSSSGQSNVVFGYVNNHTGNKVVPFGFKDDVSFPASLILRNLDNESRFTSLSYSNQSNVAQYRTLETGAEEGYHEIEFKTSGTQGPQGFRMTALGYVEETVTFGRFTGDIGNWRNGKSNQQQVIDVDNVFKSDNIYSFGIGEGKNPYFYFPNPKENQGAIDNLKIKVTFDRISELDASKGLVLNPSGSGEEEFTMTVESKLSQAPVFYVEITFYNADSVPGSMSATSDDGIEERVWRYPGTGEQRYLWNLARKDETHAHTITFRSDHRVIIKSIIVKSAYKMSYIDYEAP